MPWRIPLATMLAIGVLASLYGAALRYRAEQRNRRAEIAVDYAEVTRLAAAVGVPAADVLFRLKQSGVTSVAVTEDTVQDMVDAGRAQLNASGPMTGIQVGDAAGLQRIVTNLTMRGVRAIPPDTAASVPSVLLWTAEANGAAPSAGYVRLLSAYPPLSTMGIGIPPEQVETIRASGLKCVARIANFPGARLDTLKAVLSSIRAAGADIVVCTGTEVLGHYGATSDAAQALASTGVLWGQVEFGKQKGDDGLARALNGHYIRVHSISEGEMGTLSEADAIDRFVRAARERNIRLLYVRMVTFAGVDALERNLKYVAAIVSGMGRGGLLRPGAAMPFEETDVPVWAFGLSGLAGGALAAWLAIAVLPCARDRWLLLVLLLPLACGVLACIGESGRRLVALLSALSAPTLACLPMVAAVQRPSDGRPKPSSEALWALVRASLVTAIGIASVVGLLASRPFMVKTSQFLGIKAAHAVPILLIAILLVIGLPDAAETVRQARDRIKRRLNSFLAQPVLLGAMVMTLAILAALMLAVARTGNEPGVGVSGLEMRFRALLDAGLPIRPRTKEFLLGHPAFVLAFGLAALGKQRWASVLAVIGVVGQVSVLNTFCHIHTPLTLSALRVLVGLVLGGLIGLMALAASVKFCRQSPPSPVTDVPLAEP